MELEIIRYFLQDSTKVLHTEPVRGTHKPKQHIYEEKTEFCFRALGDVVQAVSICRLSRPKDKYGEGMWIREFLNEEVDPDNLCKFCEDKVLSQKRYEALMKGMDSVKTIRVRIDKLKSRLQEYLTERQVGEVEGEIRGHEETIRMLKNKFSLPESF